MKATQEHTVLSNLLNREFKIRITRTSICNGHILSIFQNIVRENKLGQNLCPDAENDERMPRRNHFFS